MKNSIHTPSHRPLFKLLLIFAALLFGIRSHATPYASELANTGSTISFVLNEPADDVRVIVGTTTNTLGALPAGTFTTNLVVASPYYIQAFKNAPLGWKTPGGSNFTATVNGVATPTTWAGRIQISSDANTLTSFSTPRGIAVNRNPASPFFGRVYVANSTPATTGRLVGRGLYTMKADLSDSPNAYGDTAQTAGLAWGANSVAPYQLSIGDDDYVYVADFYDNSSLVSRMDPNLLTGELVLDYTGGPSSLPAGQNHGSTKRIRATGSLAGGNLKLYTMDEDYTGPDPVNSPSPKNSIWRYDIGAGPLTNQNAGTLVATPSPSWTVTGTEDFVMGTNGYIYATQNRTTPVEPCVYVIDAITGLSVTNTRDMWRTITGIATNNDLFCNLEAIALSPDNNYLALNLLGSGPNGPAPATSSDTWIVPLINGIPDIANRMLLNSGTVSQGRGVEFDAAGNLYTISSGDARLRAWSPGGTTTATTGSDGTFTVTTPPTLVSVSASTNTIVEANGSSIFTITRSGDTASALVVNYTMSGTASNNVDYSFLPGTVTFAAGQASTNITVTALQDSIAESTETITLTIAPAASYGLGIPAAATVSILDDESPVVTVSVTQPILLEGYSNSKATFKVTRLGLLTPALNVNLSYAGTATAGVDYNAPLSVAIDAGAVTTNFTITPIDDTAYEGSETIIASVAAGTGYSIAATNSATATIIDDEYPAGQVLFSDDFETDSSLNWKVNSADGFSDTEALFSYDYGQPGIGIPPAPHSVGGTTRGVRLRADINLGANTGISISPLTNDFEGDYRLTADMWINYNGPLAVGGAGSTQGGNAGIGTSGTMAQWNGGGSDGVWFAWNSDGDVAEGNAGIRDFNIFVPPALSQLPATSGAYAAGTNTTSRDVADPYYVMWGNATAPAAQVAAYPGPTAGANQTGTSRTGCLGMAWHRLALTKLGTNVTWAIDGVIVATVDITPYIDLGGGSPSGYTLSTNISLGYDDAFAGKSDNTEMSFQLFDNVRVEAISTQAAVISGIQVINNGTQIQINFTGSTSDTTNSFTVMGSATLSSSSASYTTEAATITQLSPGLFQATVPKSTVARFYRIKR